MPLKSASTFFVIPARRNSKGFPFKNRKLLDYTINEIPIELHGKTIVSTDDEEIIEIHFISDELRESMLLELVSISEEELCFINRGWDDVYDFEIDDNMRRNLTDKELDKMRTTCLYKED